MKLRLWRKSELGMYKSRRQSKCQGRRRSLSLIGRLWTPMEMENVAEDEGRCRRLLEKMDESKSMSILWHVFFFCKIVFTRIKGCIRVPLNVVFSQLLGINKINVDKKNTNLFILLKTYLLFVNKHFIHRTLLGTNKSSVDNWVIPSRRGHVQNGSLQYRPA